MNNRKPEDLLFGTIASCTVLFVGTALAGLVYQLITAAVPFFESILLSQGR